MAEYWNDFAYFCKIIEESRIDNKTLVIELEDCLGIPAKDINSMTEIKGCPQYHIRYKDIMVIMFWNEDTMSFEFPGYFGICEGNSLKRLVHY